MLGFDVLSEIWECVDLHSRRTRRRELGVKDPLQREVKWYVFSGMFPAIFYARATGVNSSFLKPYTNPSSQPRANLSNPPQTPNPPAMSCILRYRVSGKPCRLSSLAYTQPCTPRIRPEVSTYTPTSDFRLAALPRYRPNTSPFTSKLFPNIYYTRIDVIRRGVLPLRVLCNTALIVAYVHLPKGCL
jgi:hypothetical protein